jgi:hypothetical protein
MLRCRVRAFVSALPVAAVLLHGGIANAQAAGWEPDFRFPGTFFPSFVIAAAGRDMKGPTETPTASGYLGSGSFGIKVLEAPVGSKLKVEVEVPEIGVSGDLETSSDGKPRLFVPRLNWSQARRSAQTPCICDLPSTLRVVAESRQDTRYRVYGRAGEPDTH